MSQKFQGTNLTCLPPAYNWAASWQNQQNDMCAQQRLRSAWASTQTDQSLLCAQWVAKDPMFLHADSEDSDQTGRMPIFLKNFLYLVQTITETSSCWIGNLCKFISYNCFMS